jgi:hypothetical protein
MTSFNDNKADLEEEGIPADMKPAFMESALNPIYQAKLELLNDALQEIGMGKYQVSLMQFASKRISSCRML